MTLAARLRRALATVDQRDLILLTGDDRDADVGASDALYEAAVLVAVTDRPEPGLILTRRHEDMRNHAGQVAFPGGRIDPTDIDAVAAALREAQEEIELAPQAVEIVGIADRYRTVTGFDVTPVVGVIAPDIALRANEAEVADIFEVPLDFVLEPANHLEASVEWQGRDRHYYEILWNDRRIWGATAAMIVNLSRRLRWVV